MMERQDYTNPWADKLQEVQLPDANDSWNVMAALLDKEMPLPGRSNRRRWLLLVLLLLLLIGVCNCPRLTRRLEGGRNTTHVTTPNVHAATPGAPILNDATRGTATPVAGTPGTGTPGAATSGAGTSGDARSKTGVASGAPDGRLRRSNRGDRKDSLSGPGDTHYNAGTAGAKISRRKTPGTSTSGTTGFESGTSGSGTSSVRNSRSNTPTVRKPKPGDPTVRDSSPGTPSGQDSRSNTPVVRKKTRPGTPSAGDSRSGTAAVRRPWRGTPGGRKSRPDTSVVRQSGSDVVPTGRPPANTTTTRPEAPLVTGKSGKDSVIAATKKNGENDRPAKKTGIVPENKKTPPADTTQEDPVRGLVAGIGFNQFFSVGQQQKSDYNSGGTSGGLGDYLPVPMVRYYFSKKLYIQLEAQFNTPQYTKKNLIASQSPGDTLSPGRIQQSSVTIKKLFYFNLPLSVHYSPFPNLYLGGGLQYSRLSNGVGLFEDKVVVVGGTDSVKATKIQSFKGDTTYQKIRTNEFRFLLDINYTYKRFIAGARYNQALSRFLDVHISNNQVTQARNSSLQLYLRYILWDNRKKRPSGSK